MMRFLYAQTMLTSRIVEFSDFQQSLLLKSFFSHWPKRTLHNFSQCVQVRPEIRLPAVHASQFCPLHTTTARTQAADFIVTAVFLPKSAAQAALTKSFSLNQLWKGSSHTASPAKVHFPKTFSSSAPATDMVYTDLVDPRATPSDPNRDQVGLLHQSANHRSTHEPLHGLRKKNKEPVAVAISGGVDSAVAAMLLKDAGWVCKSHPPFPLPPSHLLYLPPPLSIMLVHERAGNVT